MMPNIIRNKVFTEFALETTKDSIKYVRPFFSKTASGHPLNDKSADYDGFIDSDENYDPWNYSKGGEFNTDDFRKALYEDTRDRHNSELANGIVVGVTEGEAGLTKASALITGENTLGVLFKKVEGGAFSKEAAFESGKWGVDGNLYVDGYTYLYGMNPGDNPEKVEQQVIAIQDKGSGQFFAAPGFEVTIVKSPQVRDKFLVAPPKVGPSSATLNEAVATTGTFVLEIKVDKDTAPKWFKDGETELRAFGRYNSESDFEGNFLGEVELRMDEYMFKPSPTTIGVSWSQLTEITLDRQTCPYEVQAA